MPSQGWRRYRLADDVLRYGATDAPSVAFPAGAVGAYDGALSPALFEAVRASLAPDGDFWPSHAYDDESSGFFSYVHSLDDGTPTVVVRAARALRKAFRKSVPAIAEATGIEWWTHRRPHGAGHQLHFDSADEGAGADGPQHPLCSVVLYLSEARLGGPTLVTTQESGATTMPRRGCAHAAVRGYQGSRRRRGRGDPPTAPRVRASRPRRRRCLVPPAPNRAACFRGDLLHAVLPGRGAAPGGPDARRVTLMISFWRRPHATATRQSPPVAAMRFPEAPPSVATPHAPDAWAAPFYAAVPAGKAPRRAALPVPVGALWARVPAAADDDFGEVALPGYEECWQGF